MCAALLNKRIILYMILSRSRIISIPNNHNFIFILYTIQPTPTTMVKLALMLCVALLEEGLKSKRPGLRVMVIGAGDSSFEAISREMMPQRWGLSLDFRSDGHEMFESLWDSATDNASSPSDMLAKLTTAEQTTAREFADTLCDHVLRTLDMRGNEDANDPRPPELHISFSSSSIINAILLCWPNRSVCSEPAIWDTSHHSHVQLAC
jgi:hypothetical protein